MRSEWSSGLDLLLGLDRSAGPRDGIERALREAMRAGRLAAGAALPSSRSLAADLGVARGTVSAAYGQLAAEGYLELRQGALPRVSWAPGRPAVPEIRAASDVPRWDFRPGRPDSASFPRGAWSRAQRQVLDRAPDTSLGYGDPLGSPVLRRVLTGYLGRARGVDTVPGRLLICNGFTQALTLVCLTLARDGVSTLAVEDPCAPRYRRLAGRLGLRVVPVGCDQEGLRVTELAATGAGAVLVTPAHQYPLGVTMSAARRTALVAWARARRALIVEDDYDGEFRYDRQPIGALQQLDPEHVVYAGSTSKTLAPGLRLGWLAGPAGRIGPLAEAKDDLDRGTSALDQLTFAELVGGGAFDRHVRRMRTAYRRRRDELAAAIAAVPGEPRLAGIAAGLHAVVHLPGDGPDAERLRSRAARNSVAVETLASYWSRPPDPAPRALVIGFGTPAAHAFRPGLRALTEVLS